MEEAVFTEAAVRTVSAWLHTRGSPPYARAGWIKEGVLPPVSEAKFGHALAAWTAIVGVEHVVSSSLIESPQSSRRTA
jgi:hypothetical protein